MAPPYIHGLFLVLMTCVLVACPLGCACVLSCALLCSCGLCLTHVLRLHACDSLRPLQLCMYDSMCCYVCSGLYALCLYIQVNQAWDPQLISPCHLPHIVIYPLSHKCNPLGNTLELSGSSGLCAVHKSLFILFKVTVVAFNRLLAVFVSVSIGRCDRLQP